MESFRKNVQSGIEKVRRYSLGFIYTDKVDLSKIKGDYFCRDIIVCSRKLEEFATLTAEEKVDSIRRIGIASWIGGPAALNKAGAQLFRLIRLFDKEHIDIRIEIIKCVSEICWFNKYYQELIRTEGFLETILDTLKIENSLYLKLQKWIIYALICLLSENAENHKFILEQCSYQTLLRFKSESWYFWSRNEANVLIGILGYEL